MSQLLRALVGIKGEFLELKTIWNSSFSSGFHGFQARTWHTYIYNTDNILLLIFWVKLQKTFHITVWFGNLLLQGAKTCPLLPHIFTNTASCPFYNSHSQESTLSLAFLWQWVMPSPCSHTCWPFPCLFRYTGYFFSWFCLSLVCFGWLALFSFAIDLFEFLIYFGY